VDYCKQWYTPGNLVPMQKRVVALVRVSKDRDIETSTETQEDAITEYCDSRNWILVKVFYEEGVSAYDDGPRPKRDAAMKMILNGQADVMMVWKQDRFERRLMRFMRLWLDIKDAGGDFVSLSEDFDTTTRMGQRMMLQTADFAEAESEAKRDRALPFHERRSRLGLPPGGPRPFGYQRVTRPPTQEEAEAWGGKKVREKITTLEIDETEAAIIRKMACQIINGKALHALAIELEAEGVYGSRGKALTVTGIRKMLTSPTVAGLREYGDDFKPGCWPAILERGQWDAVREILSDPHRRTNFSEGGPAHLLSGFITCGTKGCTDKMVRKTHPRGTRYLCRSCNTSIPIQEADKAVVARLLDLIDPQAWKLLKTQGRGYDAKLIAKLQAEAEMYGDMMIKGEFADPATYRKLNADVVARIDAAKSGEPLDLPDIDDLQTGFKGLSLAQKRTVIMTLLQSVTVQPYDLKKPQQPHERIRVERVG